MGGGFCTDASERLPRPGHVGELRAWVETKDKEATEIIEAQRKAAVSELKSLIAEVMGVPDLTQETEARIDGAVTKLEDVIKLQAQREYGPKLTDVYGYEANNS